MIAVALRGETARGHRGPAQLRRQHEQAAIDVADADDTARVVGVIAPGAVEIRAVAGRIGIEESRLAQRAVVDRGEIEDAQAALVVRLEGVAVVDILVVIRRAGRAVMKEFEMRRGKILHVPDIGARVVALFLFVQFVVDEQVAAIRREPALVGIAKPGIADSSDLDGVRLVGDVDDRDGILVCREADFTTEEGGIRSVIIDALRIVRIAVGAEAAGERRSQRILHVDHVQACSTGLAALARAHGIGEAGILVDHDVVRAAKISVPGILGEGDRRRGHVAQTVQVEHLQAVVLRLGNDQRIVSVGLDVAPGRIAGMGREIAQAQRMLGIGDVDEGRAVVESDQGVFLA